MKYFLIILVVLGLIMQCNTKCSSNSAINLYENGKYEKAAKIFHKKVTSFGEYEILDGVGAVNAYYLSLCYEKLGESEKSQQVKKEYLEDLQKDYPEIANAIQKEANEFAAAQLKNNIVGVWNAFMAGDALNNNKDIPLSNLRTKPSYCRVNEDGTFTVVFDGARNVNGYWEISNGKPRFYSGNETSGVLNNQGYILIRTGGILRTGKPTIINYFFKR